MYKVDGTDDRKEFEATMVSVEELLWDVDVTIKMQSVESYITYLYQISALKF